MKPEIKALWLQALRNGEYNQSSAELRDKNGFCCLGVLCDLHAKSTNNRWSEYLSYMGTSDTLPEEVSEWAGLGNDDNPQINNIPLTDLNDGVNGVHQHTFDEIADLIEKEL